MELGREHFFAGLGDVDLHGLGVGLEFLGHGYVYAEQAVPKYKTTCQKIDL